MRRKKRTLPRKKRTREHVIADLSANHVERFVLRCGYAVERLEKDYGLDLALFTFDHDGNLESGVVWMQLKATDDLRLDTDRNAIVVRLARADLLSWLADIYPVILVVYDARLDKAYWVHLQEYFRDRLLLARLWRRASLTIYVPVENVISEEAIRRFALLKAQALAEE